MKTLNKSLVVEAALAGLFAAAFVMPAVAQDAPKGDAPSDKPAPAKKPARLCSFLSSSLYEAMAPPVMRRNPTRSSPSSVSSAFTISTLIGA